MEKLNKRQQYIEEHSEFYTIAYRKLINGLLIFLSIIFLLLGIIIYQHFTRPLPKYFATTIDGRLIEMIPANE